MTLCSDLIYVIALVITATILFFPVKSFSAGAVKYMNILSVYSDDKDGGLRNPEGVTCSDDSRIIVADTANHRLLRYKLEDRTLSAGGEIVVPELTYPVMVKMNSRDEIFVLDGRLRRIARLSPEGVFRGYLEPAGLTAPENYVPGSFDIDKDGNIYIIDISSERVILLDPEGVYRGQISYPEGFGFFSGITVDFKGNILLVDSIQARIYYAAKGASAFSPLTESMKDLIRFPTGIATDNRGRIYLVDRNGSRIIVIGQDGSYLGQMSARGWKEGLLNYPSQICINEKGEVFIADTNNNRVQIFMLIK